MLAKDNGWGYTRILGELRKLGIKAVSRNTVKNILKRYGYDPGPKRGTGTWDEFFKIHVATLWQCDFFSKKVLTTKGFRDLFVLVFLHAETRRVFISPSTFHPNEACVNEQARAFLKHIDETGLGATIVMHDRDTKFAASFCGQRAKGLCQDLGHAHQAGLRSGSVILSSVWDRNEGRRLHRPAGTVAQRWSGRRDRKDPAPLLP